MSPANKVNKMATRALPTYVTKLSVALLSLLSTLSVSKDYNNLVLKRILIFSQINSPRKKDLKQIKYQWGPH